MPTFQILCFIGNLLEQAEEAEARDLVEAVEKIAGKAPHLKVEVWHNHRRVAEIGPSPVYPLLSRRKRKSD